MVVVFTNPIQQSSEGFYAKNNPYQMSGPKGFTEIKILENEDMFVRTDLPGAELEYTTVNIDKSKKTVTVDTFAPSQNIHDSSPRSYVITTRLFCDCCQILYVLTDISDGVLRQLIAKTRINVPQRSSALSGPSSREDLRGPCPHRLHGSDRKESICCCDMCGAFPALTGQVLQAHPCVIHGPDTAYEYKLFPDGSLYVRLDMPGVPKDSFTVSMKNGRVKVTGEAPAVKYDSAGRFYSADVAFTSVDCLPRNKLIFVAHNGVIRLHIGPV